MKKIIIIVLSLFTSFIFINSPVKAQENKVPSILAGLYSVDSTLRGSDMDTEVKKLTDKFQIFFSDTLFEFITIKNLTTQKNNRIIKGSMFPNPEPAVDSNGVEFEIYYFMGLLDYQKEIALLIAIPKNSYEPLWLATLIEEDFTLYTIKWLSFFE